MLSLQHLVFCASTNAYEQDEILIKKDRNDTKVEIMTVLKEKVHGPPIYAIPGNDPVEQSAPSDSVKSSAKIVLECSDV
jgi:hypothetical protein